MIDWQLVANISTMFGVVVAVGVAFHTMYNNKKNLKLEGLGLAFKKFNNMDTRNARKNILVAHGTFLKENNHLRKFNPSNFHEHKIIDLLDIYPELEDDIMIVKSDFEEIAVMGENGLIDEEAYFDAYWGMMLRCFSAMHGNIIASRRKSGLEHYTIYYEKQCIRAIDYWRRTASNDEIRYYPKRLYSGKKKLN